MGKVRAVCLDELAELILAIGRQLRPPTDLSAPMCSPVESTVMRFINQNPGTSARAVSEATMLSSSNLARILRGLEEKGLIRRESDLKDARAVRLYLTDLAQANLKLLRQSWNSMLDGLIDDEETIDLVNGVLRRVDEGLLARRKSQTSTDGRPEASADG